MIIVLCCTVMQEWRQRVLRFHVSEGEW